MWFPTLKNWLRRVNGVFPPLKIKPPNPTEKASNKADLPRSSDYFTLFCSDSAMLGLPPLRFDHIFSNLLKFDNVLAKILSSLVLCNSDSATNYSSLFRSNQILLSFAQIWWRSTLLHSSSLLHRFQPNRPIIH